MLLVAGLFVIVLFVVTLFAVGGVVCGCKLDCGIIVGSGAAVGDADDGGGPRVVWSSSEIFSGTTLLFSMFA